MAASVAPVRAYDRCTEGWTDTGSENEPSFQRKRLSLQTEQGIHPGIREQAVVDLMHFVLLWANTSVWLCGSIGCITVKSKFSVPQSVRSLDDIR